MEGRSDDKGCLVSYVVIAIGVLIYKLATTSLDEYSKNGTVIISFIALFGGSYFAFKMLIMMFKEWIEDDKVEGRKALMMVLSLIPGVLMAFLLTRIEALSITFGVLALLIIIVILLVWLYLLFKKDKT